MIIHYFFYQKYSRYSDIFRVFGGYRYTWLAPRVEIFQICVSRDYKNAIPGTIVFLDFFVKHFSNYLSLPFKNLFVDDFLKKSYIELKQLYGYKLVRAAKWSERNRCIKQYRRNHKKQHKIFMLKKKWILAWCI